MSDIEYIDLNQVRRELWGKSHYFDADTMRVLSRLLLQAVKLPSGDLLCLESYRLGYGGVWMGREWTVGREYRVVLLREGGATRGDELPCYTGLSKAQAQRQFQKLLMGGLTC